MSTINIINGPNLNEVGIRETSVYGKANLNQYLNKLKEENFEINIEIFQSNHEGEIIQHLQKIKDSSLGIIINPAAYTHTSIGIRDALAIQSCPIIEIHISKISDREDFRHTSLMKDYAWSYIEGYGIDGYRIALERIKELSAIKSR
ncbi:MAG: 3-dehydroquinate dehydratase [Saprospiraceae bacterium]|nr:3-dehydroquinate dehydratase [Saprospiraceae bacterium]